MPTIGLLRDARFHDHDTTPNHPERPARLDAIETLLDDSGLSAESLSPTISTSEQAATSEHE